MEAAGDRKPCADEKGQDEQGRARPGDQDDAGDDSGDPGNDLLARRPPRIRRTECKRYPADNEDQARDDDQGVHGPVGGQDREPKPDRDEAREERYPPQVPDLLGNFPHRRVRASPRLVLRLIGSPLAAWRHSWLACRQYPPSEFHAGHADQPR